jgi:hypothetical protein
LREKFAGTLWNTMAMRYGWRAISDYMYLPLLARRLEKRAVHQDLGHVSDYRKWLTHRLIRYQQPVEQ